MFYRKHAGYCFPDTFDLVRILSSSTCCEFNPSIREFVIELLKLLLSLRWGKLPNVSGLQSGQFLHLLVGLVKFI